jgi:hypothetical protein
MISQKIELLKWCPGPCFLSAITGSLIALSHFKVDDLNMFHNTETKKMWNRRLYAIRWLQKKIEFWLLIIAPYFSQPTHFTATRILIQFCLLGPVNKHWVSYSIADVTYKLPGCWQIVQP